MDPNMYTAAMKDEKDALSQYSADQFALQVTPNANTLLHVAAQFNSCLYGADDILSKCPSLLRRVNNNGDTPIHVAVERRHFDVVYSLIHFANSAQGGGAAAVREILRARNHNGDTPLPLAARSLMVWTFFRAIGTLLTKEDPWLDHGPNKAGETPLYLYVERGHDVEDLSLMLETCTPQEYGGPGGRTALHAVVIRRKRFSENRGADSTYLGLDKDKSAAYVTANNDEGNTALHRATAKGDTKVMIELLSKCPDCWEMVNGKGQNILHIAADLERDEATEYISKQPWIDGLVDGKDHGADRKALNNDGLTPYEILLPKIRRKNWLQRKRFLRDLHEKDQGDRGKMTQKKTLPEVSEKKDQGDNGKMIQKEPTGEGMQNASEEQKGKTAGQTGFTIPGGYHGDQDSNQGTAVLVREAAFKAFVITNTIAMVCSTSSVFLYVSASLFNIRGHEEESRARRYAIAFELTITAMLAMMLAFITGAYAVLAHSLGLAIVTCVIACPPFFVYAFDLKKHFAEEIEYAKDSLSPYWRKFIEYAKDPLSSYWRILYLPIGGNLRNLRLTSVVSAFVLSAK
ncbi:hypothetical protein RHSIM_RhsimUnG0174300 [Rhododendron simsii]|uniref:PGG domain-containing protein n=1 Tax=Rhododendron simsii TaxID=118357 RepID=A0A834FUP1_RHOSS|nr:hypothetical protein RHSIM_RhsimUnG0174300 [Rhododendron simsii]